MFTYNQTTNKIVSNSFIIVYLNNPEPPDFNLHIATITWECKPVPALCMCISVLYNTELSALKSQLIKRLASV